MSEIVKGFGGVSAWTPDWFVICWSVMVPDYRSKHFDDTRGMVGVDPQQSELFLRCLENDKVVILGILGYFLSALRNRPMLEQDVGAVELDLRQFLVLDGLAVIGKRARDVRASHFEQKLALFHFIAKPRVDFHDSPRGERRHRHLPRDVGIHDSGYVQLRRGNVLTRRRQGKLLRVIHLEVVGIQVGLHGCGDRTSARGLRVVLGRDLPVASGDEKAQAHTHSCFENK